MSKSPTKADLLAKIAALEAAASKPQKATPKVRPVYVDPLAEQRKAYREYREQLRAKAIASKSCVPFLSFSEYLTQ
jgi:hypothetical protein